MFKRLFSGLRRISPQLRTDEIEMHPVHPTQSRATQEPEVNRSTWFQKLKDGIADITRRVDDGVSRSSVGQLFQLQGSGHPKEIAGACFSTEIRALTESSLTSVDKGITTFTTMAYVIAVNAFILAESGYGCPCHKPLDLQGNCANRVEWTECYNDVKLDLITATTAVSGLSSILFGFFTNLPVALGPGMGLNAYFTYQVVGVKGSGLVNYRVALTAVFMEGIGLFLTLIGMSYTSGLGIVMGGISTPLTIGGCPTENLNEAGQYVGGHHIRNTPLTYFPNNHDGDQRFNYFSKVVSFHPIHHTLAQQQWNLAGESGSRFAIALFTFLYVDIIDCTATLYSMARFCSRARRDNADFPRSTVAFCVDAFCISMGALLGLSPVTAFIESSAGIAEGGRTGLTAIFAGFCFLISLFFAPLFASIPTWATGSTLILVGCMMIRQVTKINWGYVGDAIPSFITMAFIPFTFSCAYGLIAGLFAYVVINGIISIVVKVSRQTIVPENYELKEYWSWRFPGEKPWIARAVLRCLNWIKRREDRQASFALDSRDESTHADQYRSDTGSKAAADVREMPSITTPEPFRKAY
ncbi:hypothetical protein VTG60DRAFT_5180 [Thermothelomyces hinnuleus]